MNIVIPVQIALSCKNRTQNRMGNMPLVAVSVLQQSFTSL
jgi:hypothetical protein